ncbi:hypothetical protein FRC07_007090 [Ceratobasidium sp. 392]|nr:hypothetical protein FRC07_007090 [Ceratobasidium sp. 392]
MDHTASGSQAPTSAATSSAAMTSLDTPSQSPQVLYMTPNHRVTKARYVTSSDPRGYVPVYEYPLNGQWIMMDTDDGYVLWTGIWKALGNSKADIVKILESQPDLATKLRRVRGGYLKMQGTWMARDSPDQPGYGKVVTRPPAKPRRSKKSINDASSPPVGSATLPYSHDSPVSPSAESGISAQEFFESPVAGNTSMAFDTSQRERSRSDSQYLPYQQSHAGTPMRYNTVSSGYVSAPTTAQAMTFSSQSPPSAGFAPQHHVDQYHQSPTHTQTHMSPQQQHMSPPRTHMSSQQMGQQQQQYATYDYGYAGYNSGAGDQSSLRLNLAGQHQNQHPHHMSDDREAQYRQYSNQY